ncbi:hypothetical protein F0562_016815 [Nyssa sinensis]|uniref:AP2/ERF domain-containing protein n=1 Tax=Nyssa sinensis TaxID=561372 RepID=A0A5J4ZF97_9ASTE|nr:hypothetical protein F0562_016815 [Nyssa sinensis]
MAHSTSSSSGSSGSGSNVSLPPEATAPVPGRHPTYRGVRRRRSSGKWVVKMLSLTSPTRLLHCRFLPPPPRVIFRRQQPQAASAAGAAMDALSGGGSSGVAANPVAPEKEPSNEFVDEDLIFDMPNVLMNMAEGMLLSPPRLDIAGDDTENSGGQNLWNYP